MFAQPAGPSAYAYAAPAPGYPQQQQAPFPPPPQQQPRGMPPQQQPSGSMGYASQGAPGFGQPQGYPQQPMMMYQPALPPAPSNGRGYGNYYQAPAMQPMMGGRGRGTYPYAAPPMGRGFGGVDPYAAMYGGGMAGSQVGFRPKRPFVGGTLETQRTWERSNLCCFFIAGGCKFGQRCRYSHEDDGTRPCQFGTHCRMAHANRGQSAPLDAPPAEPTA